MRLVTAHELIITRERGLPLPLAIASFELRALASAMARVREAIPAIWAARLTPQTWILRAGRPFAVTVVPPTAVHKRSNQLPHCIQVHNLTRRTIIVQQHALE